MTSMDVLVADGTIREHAGLAQYTTYKLGGPARYLAEPNTEEELAALAGAGVDLLVLGRGSNLLVADAGFPGLVVRLGEGFATITVEDDGTVVAGGAAPLPLVARTAARAGRGGLEFYVGIPGSVGGAVRMNAGCHGSETAEWLLHARIVDLVSGEVEERDPAALDLRYRHSNLRRNEVVSRAAYRTVETSRDRAEQVMREVSRWRREHQPGGTLNAGSVFKNPPGDSAGRIIDSLGLKGFAVGGASVSDRHANFFVADSSASAQDVYDLVWAVRRRVGEATGVWLVPEVQFAGSFRPSPDEGMP